MTDVTDVTFLGTGTSTGVPVIGCSCDVCQSTDPADRRLRASVLVRTGHATILIDASPDLRAQALLSRPSRIDGVLFTHAHADHTAGLDELRRFNAMQQERIPVWAMPSTATDLTSRFAYAFDHSFSFFGGKPDLDLHVIDPGLRFVAAGVTVRPLPVMHGRLPILGFRIGGFAYVTDVKTIPESTIPLLADVDTLVLTCLRRTDHVAHMSLDEALDIVARLKPRHALLTHVAHDLGFHKDVERDLPANVTLARDGLRLTGIPDPAS